MAGRNYAYKNTRNKAGELNVIFEPEVAKRIRDYCRINNLNCKKYVNNAMREHVQKDNESRYESMTREELL